MQRRNFLKSAMSLPLLAAADEKVARAATGMPSPKIKDISVIECEPAGVRLTVVKVTTDQDGLYGYGCATFTQRADLVRPAVEKYLKPDRKSTRLNSSHPSISYAVFCLKKKKK